jgi:hypothetical protein
VEKESEMMILSRVFDDLFKEEEQLKDVLQRNKVDIKDSYLLSLLNGNFLESSEYRADIFSFKYSGFVCALIAINRYESFNKQFTLDQQYYFKSLILKICEEVLNSITICSGILLDRGRIAIVINIDKKGEDLIKKELKENFEQIMKEIDMVMHNKISIGIGGYHTGYSGIKESYMEAIEVLKKELFLATEALISGKKITTKYMNIFIHQLKRNIFLIV